MVLFICRGEEKEEKNTDLVIPLKKPVYNKPQAKQKEDVQMKEIYTTGILTDKIGGNSVSRGSLEETAVREILEG
jgi:hypothetical protein